MCDALLLVLWVALCFFVGQLCMAWVLISESKVARSLRRYIPFV